MLFSLSSGDRVHVPLHADGIGTVTLKGGQTVTISGLPEGTTYQVSETNAGDGWTTAWTDAKVAS